MREENRMYAYIFWKEVMKRRKKIIRNAENYQIYGHWKGKGLILVIYEASCCSFPYVNLTPT